MGSGKGTLDLLAEGKGTYPGEEAALYQPAQAPGMPKGIIPPPPRPGGPGAKSDPGPRAGGDLPGCVRPSRAGQDSAPELLRGAGSGRRGAPGGGGRGWSGLAVRGPGRALGPGSYPGFLTPSSPPQDYTGPTSSCALIWILGRTSGGGCPAPNPIRGLRPVALVMEAPLPGCIPPLQRVNGTVLGLPGLVVAGDCRLNHY